MQFTTPVDIPKSSIPISHSDRIALIGSCFADNIGQMLADCKFNTIQNPFGTLYNPSSIAWLIERSIDGIPFSSQSDEIFQDEGGRWHSWIHHSKYSCASAEELVIKMNLAGSAMAETLKTAGVLIVTFGTSIIYTLKNTKKLVANCHKQKDSLFERRMLTTEEITRQWTGLIRKLHEQNPGLRIILTVSPIRHQRDGMHVNQLSKGTLLLAVDDIISRANSLTAKPQVEYFPAYEIMMDELRDYRFYADDMTHPSPIAIQYIWERFADTYFNKDTKILCSQCQQIQKALNHKTDNPESPAYKSFIERTLQQIETIRKQHPQIRMDKEIEICNTRLRK